MIYIMNYSNISIILVFIFLLYKFNSNIVKKNIEKMSDVTIDNETKNKIINKSILNKYNFNFESMKNLGYVMGYLYDENELVLPSNVDSEKFNLLSQGMILAYYPKSRTDLDDLPDKGWAICDGTTVKGYKTPDLTEKFIFFPNDYYIGNSDDGKVDVTLNNGNLPLDHDHDGKTYENSHQHTYNEYVGKGHGGGAYPGGGTSGNTSSGSFRMASITHEVDWWPTYEQNLTRDRIEHTHRNQSEFGGSQAHNNMPPYLYLVYIIKL